MFEIQLENRLELHIYKFLSNEVIYILMKCFMKAIKNYSILY